MSIGDEIPFRRSKRDHATGSLVFDQARHHATESAGDPAPAQADAGTRKPEPVRL